MSKRLKTALFWCVLLGVLVYLYGKRSARQEASDFSTKIPVESAQTLVAEGQISSYAIAGNTLQLTTVEGDNLTAELSGPLISDLEQQEVFQVPPYAPPVENARSRIDPAVLAPTLIGVGLVVFLIWILRRSQNGAAFNLLDLRKTKARTVQDAHKATFADIGGNQEAIEVLRDLADFLNAPERWSTAGARIPRGVLIVGPPGCGKTLLARAVAGETKSAFFYVSATEFIEMFVGVGAARIRDTFDKAMAQKPSVIFIDELDAIGRKRGSGVGTMHEEREQALNQLLVLMDGLERLEKVVVIAATNRPDVLDAALQRPGRFDRVLRIQPPRAQERAEILQVHLRGKPVDPQLSFDLLAARTEGYTGADLELLCNEAALSAVRRARSETDVDATPQITRADFDRALQVHSKSSKVFDQLDSLLMESVSQLAEPMGRVVVRAVLESGDSFEGDLIWMNASHLKLVLEDRSGIVLAKTAVTQLIALPGTTSVNQLDLAPDRWAASQIAARM